MACGNCGEEGHTRRTCPKAVTGNEEKRDMTLLIRMDRLTPSELEAMNTELRRAKIKHAPDARVTAVEGKSTELPSKIRQLTVPKKRQ